MNGCIVRCVMPTILFIVPSLWTGEDLPFCPLALLPTKVVSVDIGPAALF